MARFMKKTVAFVLVLTTIFLFSTAAFAEYAEETVRYGNYTVEKAISSDNNIIIASMDVEPDEGYDFNNVNAEITVRWVHCTMDAIRPNNYITEVDTQTFNLNTFGGNVSLTIDELPDEHVIISATATYSLTISGVEKEFDPLTIYPY